MSALLLQILSPWFLDSQQQPTQPWLHLLWQQPLFPSPTPSRLSILNLLTPTICFGVFRWSRIWLVKESSCLLITWLHAPLRIICPVRFLPPLLPSILALPNRFWLGNSKTNSSLVLCCPLSVDVLHLMVDCPTSASVWSTFEHVLESCNCMALFRIFDRVMIPSLSKGLFDELVTTDRPILSLISTYMCFGDFVVNFVIWLRVWQTKLTFFHTLSSIVTCLLMNSSIAARFHLFYQLHPCYPYLRSLPQSMLPSVVFLGLMVWFHGSSGQR